MADQSRAVKPRSESEEKGGETWKEKKTHWTSKGQTSKSLFYLFIVTDASKTGLSADEAAAFVVFISAFDQWSTCILLSAVG